MIGARVQTFHAGRVRVGKVSELAGEVALVRFAGSLRRAWVAVRDLEPVPARKTREHNA